MESTSRKPRLHLGWLPMVCVMAMTVFSGCSSPYVLKETYAPKANERTFYHAYSQGPDIGLIYRKLEGGKVQVGISIVNDGEMPITVPMKLSLFVNGNFYYGESPKERMVILGPGETKRIMCKPEFVPFIVRPVKNLVNKSEGRVRIYKGRRVVQVSLGPYRTPRVIMDLAPENRVPFRFEEQP